MFKEKSSKKKIATDTNESYTLDAMHNNMPPAACYVLT